MVRLYTVQLLHVKTLAAPKDACSCIAAELRPAPEQPAVKSWAMMSCSHHPLLGT